MSIKWIKYLLTISILVSSLVVLGQSDEKKDARSFRGGVKAGLATSQIRGDGYAGFNKVGPTAGVLVIMPFNPKFDLQVEILYTNRGSRDPADPDKGKFNSYRIEQNYIDIPILAQFTAWKLNIEIGLCAGYLISSSEYDQLGERVPFYDFHKYDIAFNGGLNFDLTEKWRFNVRSHQSLLPVAKGFRVVPGIGIFGGSFNHTLNFCITRILYGG